jgi:hypothetical protein
MLAKRLTLAALVLAFAVPAIAFASKPTTVAAKGAERTAILKGWAGTTVSRAQAACLTARVAVSNHNYATVRFDTAKSCQKYAFDGVNVLKQGTHDRWKVLFEGSSFSCPLPKIPKSVQHNFGICT